MDGNNIKTTDESEAPVEAVPEQPPMDAAGDWRAPLGPQSRERVVNKILDTFKSCIPFSGQEEVKPQLKKFAVRIEENAFTEATSQDDYLRKIAIKMVTVDKYTTSNPFPPNPQGNISRNLPESV